MVLGRGRFSKVIVDPNNEKRAVKIIDVDDQRPPHSWKCEVAALRELRSPFVIQMLAIEEPQLQKFDPQCSITMPRYNYTLENVIYAHAKAKFPPGTGWRNAMPLATAALIVEGIATALAAVHEAGIIHRDVKPENILFEHREPGEPLRPVLADFGVAWVPRIGESPKVVEVGTAEYKAPELLYGISDYNTGVDMWALGCIFARLLGNDCKPLFAPYTSDIALVGSQLEVLGSFCIGDCPSLAGSMAEQLPQNIKRTLDVGDSVYASLVVKLLNFEMSHRPSAVDVVGFIKLNK